MKLLIQNLEFRLPAPEDIQTDAPPSRSSWEVEFAEIYFTEMCFGEVHYINFKRENQAEHGCPVSLVWRTVAENVSTKKIPVPLCRMCFEIRPQQRTCLINLNKQVLFAIIGMDDENIWDMRRI